MAKTFVKMQIWYEAQLESELFDRSNLIIILSFQPALQVDCTTNGIHYGAIM